MPPDEQPINPDLLALAIQAAARYLASLPTDLRRVAQPSSRYAYEIARNCERRAPGDPAALVDQEAEERILADLLDPHAPLAVALAVAHASAIARTMLQERAADYLERFGNAIFEPDAAPGYAADALVAWGRAETTRPGWTDNAWAYVRGVLSKMMVKDLDRALRTIDPGARALYRLTLRFTKELQAADPSLDEAAARRRAEELAREQLRRRGGLNERADDPAAVERVPGTDDPQEEALWRVRLAGVEATIAGKGYTPIDRETWERFAAADFRGRDIPWRTYDVDPSTGAQRLFALLRKLRRDLGDDRW